MSLNRLLPVLHTLIVAAIPLLLLAGSIRLVMTPLTLQIEYQRPGFPEDRYGFSTADRLEYGPLGIVYLNQNEPRAYLADRTLPGDRCFPPQDDPCLMFNERELDHMQDVQVVVHGTWIAATILLGVVVLSSALIARTQNLYMLSITYRNGGLLTIGLFAFMAIFAWLAWDAFFAAFHSLFFAEGTWQFWTYDTLIRLYPEQFWIDVAFVVISLSIIGATLLIATPTIINRWRQPR